MRKINLPNVPVICLLVIFCICQPVHAQQVKESTSYQRMALLEKGRKQRTSGIVCLGIGAAMITACALLPPPDPGTLHFGPTTEQAITGVGGFVFTTVGLINFISGITKIHGAKFGLGKTSYYIHPRQSIQGPSIALQWQLGK
jgi:hypothetical protein